MLNNYDLETYLSDLLSAKNISDYCPNGLQVSGGDKIQNLVTGVTASEALIRKAIAVKADSILVHHGIIWKKDSGLLVGAYRRKIALLLEHNINLYAYHLPLDVHTEFGNNAQFGKLLNIQNVRVADLSPKGILWQGELKNKDDSGSNLAKLLEKTFNYKPLHIQAETSIKSIAWCTGGAQHFIKQAKDLGVDAFISGEISESTVHFAYENNIHYFSAGHHATECCGVQALGQHLVDKFKIKNTFINIPTPV